MNQFLVPQPTEVSSYIRTVHLWRSPADIMPTHLRQASGRVPYESESAAGLRCGARSGGQSRSPNYDSGNRPNSIEHPFIFLPPPRDGTNCIGELNDGCSDSSFGKPITTDDAKGVLIVECRVQVSSLLLLLLADSSSLPKGAPAIAPPSNSPSAAQGRLVLNQIPFRWLMGFG